MISTRRSFVGQSKSIFGLLAAVAALATACSKAPAEAALKAADEAVTAASRDGEKFAPEQLRDLTDTAKAAHGVFDRGDYAGAKTAAEAVVKDAENVVKAAAAKKAEVTKAWSDLQARVPAMGDAVRNKLNELAATKRLPKGFDKARLEQAKAGLAELDQAWGEAGTAAQSGDLVSAAEKAQAADAKAQELVTSLGIASPVAGWQGPAAKK